MARREGHKCIIDRAPLTHADLWSVIETESAFAAELGVWFAYVVKIWAEATDNPFQNALKKGR